MSFADKININSKNLKKDIKCAISQPVYLPWVGYLNLINSVDKFIFLDDSALSKQSWHTRNYIISKNNVENKLLLAVPVKNNEAKHINNMSICNLRNWRKKHVQSIKDIYSKHKFFNDLLKTINIISDPNIKFLGELNTKIIINLSNDLLIKTKFYFSSKMNIPTYLNRTDKLIQILELTKCTKYFTAIGSKEYLEKDEFAKKTNIEIFYNKEIFPNYHQKNIGKFIFNLSFIDILANLGFEGLRKYLDKVKLL